MSAGAPRATTARSLAVNTVLRDAALGLLADHPTLTHDNIRLLRGADVNQDRNGLLCLDLEQPAEHMAVRRHGRVVETNRMIAYRGITLTPAQSAALLEYIEAARLWAYPGPLFPGRNSRNPLSISGFARILRIARGRQRSMTEGEES